MTAYIIRRLLLMIPTLFGIMLVSFVIVQFAPGGPVERVIAQLSGADTGASSRIPGSGTGGDFGARGGLQGGSQLDAVTSKYRGAQGLDPEFIKNLEKQFGFDKPAYERFFIMLRNYLTFDFGKSYFRDTTVIAAHQGEAAGFDVAGHLDDADQLPTISIPLGIRKAVRMARALTSRPRRHHRGLCHAEFHGGDLPDHSVCGRFSYCDWFPLAGSRRTTWPRYRGGRSRSTMSGIWHCRLLPWRSADLRPDLAHEELVPR